jgi:hypothetical protein
MKLGKQVVGACWRRSYHIIRHQEAGGINQVYHASSYHYTVHNCICPYTTSIKRLCIDYPLNSSFAVFSPLAVILWWWLRSCCSGMHHHVLDHKCLGRDTLAAQYDAGCCGKVWRLLSDCFLDQGAASEMFGEWWCVCLLSVSPLQAPVFLGCFLCSGSGVVLFFVSSSSFLFRVQGVPLVFTRFRGSSKVVFYKTLFS